MSNGPGQLNTALSARNAVSFIGSNLDDIGAPMPDPDSEDPSLHDHFAAEDRLRDLIRDEPLSAWRFILEANSRPYSEKRRSMLAAGPLEDLLSIHGDQIISMVEYEAKNNLRFKELLRGVWQQGMTSSIWIRVQQAQQ
ncbi:DUF6869 domain-containing protein [Geothrix sp. PMB-07]|uniref:DUF6869 domain-containing protein n=1 Tax=Geothrix sp. PMB-07 TaxID=3068640 RepID=UPI002741EA07|nr:hypothetical protein [Geothrix sp. PMB-07]WLT32345.1 hypothetical protein Q9293_03225 [Geothrix sp. PMB-07]